MSLNRGLVLIRIGCNHHVDALLHTPRDKRSWDLALSSYDDFEPQPDSKFEFLHRYVGGKWDGIWNFFSNYPIALRCYAYCWLLDDDIETTPAQVDRLFKYVHSYGFCLAQPALTHDSYFSHRLTLACPLFHHRHTNFVEIMAPILSAELLQKVLPLFMQTSSGFGLDWYWQTLVKDPMKKIAIIDRVPVRHSRPLGQHLRGALAKFGSIPELERKQFCQQYSVRRLYAVATAGQMSNGRKITCRYTMAWYMIKGYWIIRKQVVMRRLRFLDYLIIIYRQFFSRLGY